MKTLAEKIAVMQAFERGEKIECDVGEGWKNCPAPIWDWYETDYRIAEKPKKKVKLLAMVNGNITKRDGISALCYSNEEHEYYIRLPQFDVEVEVDCDE